MELYHLIGMPPGVFDRVWRNLESLGMENETTEVVDERKAVSVTDLIMMLNGAAGKMSGTNPNRWLMMNAGYALRQLVDRLHKYENPTQVM